MDHHTKVKTHPLGTMLGVLHGATVTKTEWDQRINWLTVTFDNGYRLECSTGPDDSMVFAVANDTDEYWSDL